MNRPTAMGEERCHHSVHPEDIVRNGRDVFRAVYRPKRPLTVLQRIGAICLGAIVVTPFALLIFTFGDPKSLIGSDVTGLAHIFIILAFAGLALIGLRMIWNGATGAKSLRDFEQ